MTFDELIESGRVTETQLRVFYQRDIEAWERQGNSAALATFSQWLDASGWLDD